MRTKLLLAEADDGDRQKSMFIKSLNILLIRVRNNYRRIQNFLKSCVGWTGSNHENHLVRRLAFVCISASVSETRRG